MSRIVPIKKEPQKETQNNILKQELVLSLIQKQLSLTDKEKVATAESPIRVIEEGTNLECYVYFDFIMGYLVRVFNYDEETEMADVQFYETNGLPYNPDPNNTLPLPVSFMGNLQHFIALTNKDQNLYNREQDKYFAEEIRDPLGRYVRVELSPDKKNTLLVTYADIKDVALETLGQANLPLFAPETNPDKLLGWVARVQTYQIPDEIVEKLKTDNIIK